MNSTEGCFERLDVVNMRIGEPGMESDSDFALQEF